jgi:DNA-binding SARP family transcriptional activator
MTRSRQLLTGAAALAAVLTLVVGVPWALTHFIGWPLPHGLPSWQQLRAGLTTRGIPDALLLKTLALIVWAGWVVLTLSLTSEALAAVGGLRRRPLPLTGPLQPAAATLITAISVALLAVLPNGGHPHTSRPLGLSLTTGATSFTAQRTPASMVPLAEVAGGLTGAPATGLNGTNTAATFTSGRPAVSAAAEPTRYVVQRRDTLWGIAAKQLGDPLRWHQLFELNAGRPQPGGQTLTDPGQIRPGWTLLLPPPAIAAPHRDTTQPGRSHRPAAAPHSDPQPAGTSSPAAPDDGSEPPRHLTVPAPSAAASRTAPQRAPDSSAPGPLRPVLSSRPDARSDTPRVDLDRHDTPYRGEQLLVPAALLAGLSAAGALALLHRRRRYRPQPAARRRVEREPLADRLRGLPPLRAAQTPEPVGTDAARPSSEGRLSPESSALAAVPGRVALGIGDDGRELTIDLLDSEGLTLTGEGAPAAARSLLLTLLAQTDPSDTNAELAIGLNTGGGGGPEPRQPPAPPAHPAVLLLGGAAAQLIPATELPAVRRGEIDTLLVNTWLELDRRERLRAAARPDKPASNPRQPADDGLPELRLSYPDEPLPLLVLTATDPAAAAAANLVRLAHAGAPVGITVLTVLSQAAVPLEAPSSTDVTRGIGPQQFHVAATGGLTGHPPAWKGSAGSTMAEPVRAFGLGETHTARLLVLLEAAAGAAPPRVDPPAAAPHWRELEQSTGPASALGPDASGCQVPDVRADVAAAGPSRHRDTDEETAAPALVRLQLLGPTVVLVAGAPVERQLRSKSLELLALLSCHERGATADALAETLWPQAPPQRSRARLHTTVANIRTVLRAASGHPEHAFVTLQHDRYELQPLVHDSDVATLRRTLRRVAEQPPAADLLVQLQDAAATFAGEPLADVTADWAEPVRESLRMQALDVLLQLAEAHRERENKAAEIAALTRAREIDPYAEEVSRRLITAHISAGERPAAVRAFHDLEERLADLGVDPDPTTRNLIASLHRTPPRDNAVR